MTFLLAALTFLIVAMILVAAFALAGGSKQENVVRARLEAIEKGARRGNVSPELDLVRSELLSDVPVLHRILLRWAWSTRFRAYVAQAGLEIKLGKLLLLTGVLALGGYVVVQYLYQNPIFSLLATAAGALLPVTAVAIKRTRRIRAFEKGFPDAIDLLARAVRAGHSFTTGLEMIGTELAEPVAGEFRIAFDEQNFGLPLRDALLNLTERIPIIDVQFFVTALLIQKETGGNLAEVLDNLSHVIRDRFRLLGEVRIRTAQGRLTAGILIALPPMMLVLMRTLNPEYAKLLFNDPWGPYMLGAAALLQVIGAVILWKIVNIEV
ncbi:MAG TPA: type II secretion system F family protein [Terriglobia bacterium]|nr:type II secretion system F family protein [Terriglobia bacterium]